MIEKKNTIITVFSFFFAVMMEGFRVYGELDQMNHLWIGKPVKYPGPICIPMEKYIQ